VNAFAAWTQGRNGASTEDTSLLDRRFAADLASEKTWTARTACTLAIALYLAFATLDPWLIPSSAHAVWLIRAAVVVLLALLLRATWSPRVMDHYEQLACAVPLILAGGIEAMLGLASESDVARDLYYGGLVLVIVGFHTWFYLPLLRMAVISAAIVGGYVVIVIALHDGMRNLPRLAWTVLLLVSAAGICLANQARRYGYLLENFQMREALARDYADTELERRRSEHRANHDVLTGLPNRHSFSAATRSLIGSARSGRTSLAIMFVDLDGFKPINDHHGHAIGDEALRVLAQRIRRCLKASDIVARLGGDEFAVTCPLSSSAELHARTLAAKILSVVSLPLEIHRLRLSVSASVGVALYPSHGDDLEALLQRADECMYQAKREGKGRVVVAHT
jgi:diguanylate cyclase (GGDEF)-like protein